MGRREDQQNKSDNWDFEDIQFSSDNRSVPYFRILDKNGFWSNWEKITEDSMLRFCSWEMFNTEDNIEC